MPRDLKEPAGCRFSSLRKMRLPAALERAADSTRGVSIHGVGRSVGAGWEPIVVGMLVVLQLGMLLLGRNGWREGGGCESEEGHVECLLADAPAHDGVFLSRHGIT